MDAKKLQDILVDENLQALTRWTDEHSINIYLVGGSVRDALLGRELNDFDFAISAACEEVAKGFARGIGGSFFWLDEPRQQARVVKKDQGKIFTFDFAPLRGNSIEEDLLLRDFTINALACVVKGSSSSIVDIIGGASDLERGIIRSCSAACFQDDPLRLLRAVRFSATLDFTIDGETWQAIQKQSHLLDKVAGERIRDELFQILAAPGLERSLAMLLDTGLLPKLVPFMLLPQKATPTGGDQYRTDLSARIKAVALVEDIAGNLASYFPAEHEQFLSYLSHEIESGVTVLSLVKLAALIDHDAMPGIMDVIAEKLRLGNRSLRMLQTLISKSPTLATTPMANTTSRSMYRFFRDAQPAGPEMMVFALAEGNASMELCRRLVTYYYREYKAGEPELLLSGGDVMRLLNIQPGAGVGMALEQLREAEKSGMVNTKAEAEAFLTKNLLTKDMTIG